MAYELRISDWSSDVCSSDLGGKERLYRFLGRDGGAVPIGPRDVIRPRQDAVSPGAEEVGLRARTGGRHCNGAGRFQRMFEEQVERQKRLEQPRDRSEEHTSELQSLMRISYAVFCLKKKRNK